MSNKYSRPYCESCKLIWGVSSVGYIFNCTTCGKPLILKSFNPWLKIIGGLGIIFIAIFFAMVTLFSPLQIIWIGGFILGASIAVNGSRQWSKIKKIDQGKAETKKESSKEDADHIIITCGKCSKKISVLKGQGIIKITCPNCSGEYRVMS